MAKSGTEGREPNVDGLSSGGIIRSVKDMNAHQTLAFSQLLAAWNRREDARGHHDLRELAATREELEIARTNMRLATISR